MDTGSMFGALAATVGRSFFIRFFAPGLVVTLATVPLWPRVLNENLGFALGVYFVGVLVIGLVLRSLWPVHILLLGGAWLPHRFRRWAIRRLQRHLEECQLVSARPATSPTEERWWKVGRARNFITKMPHVQSPSDLGKLVPTVIAPTVLGNVHFAIIGDMGRIPHVGPMLAPAPWLGRSVHPVTSVLLAFSPETRREIHEAVAVSEAALSISLGLLFLALVYAVAVFRTPGISIAMVILCILGAYFAYTFSTLQAVDAFDEYRALASAWANSLAQN